MPHAVLITVCILNAVTFLVFGLDKGKARRRRRRVPESTLLALTWAASPIGGWLGMTAFRHKTRKTSFRIRMAAVTLLNPLWLLLLWS